MNSLPPLLQSEVSRLLLDYKSNNTNPVFIDSLPKVWACSRFVAQHCLHSPELLKNLIDSGDLFNPPNNYRQSLEKQLVGVADESALMRVLRLFRRREMVRIAWRDLAGWASLEESLKSLSDLADIIIDITLNWLYQGLIIQFGTPCYPDGSPQSLVILALGKLGGQELNFSSDIDLIFAYPSEGETKGVKRFRSNQEFFIRLGQKLIQVLTQITPDGFVYRVDMRLRPFGDGAPLAMSFAGMEDYYQAHARDWERYALVKARVAAGDIVAGESLLESLRPFVYRRYLDFNAFEALRKMKAMIDNETSRKGLNNNIKLGKGGIREIEFTCQVFQLIRGGQQPALQQRHLLTTLAQLEKYQILSGEAINCLRVAYHFLRLTENHLQAIDDKQTQNLPDNALNQARLAYSMGFSNWNQFLAQLLQHQQAVHREYEQVIAPQPAALKHSSSWQTLWMGGLQDAENLLKPYFQDSSEVARNLQQLLESRTIQKLSQNGREKLDSLIPLAISIAIKQRFPDEALLRTLKLIESVARRSVYLSLLVERPEVLKQWVYLCGESAWIAEQITRYPLLLDELLDPRSLYDPLKPDELENALQAVLAHLPNDDLDMQMNSLRQFKRANVLHIAAAELSGKLTTTIASDYLATLADSLMRRALSIALDYLEQKHGQPRYLVNGEQRTAELCIVAYGKAGGIELSYGSDLDIVFLHDSSGNNAYTDGHKSIDNHVFFLRLAQRIIHILTINTPAGILYEVDSRLRPGGDSGQLVSSFEAFQLYQKENAWTWEHQALVRARAVAGTQNTIAQFEQIRREILSIRRDIHQLKQDVCDMRTKMRDNLDKTKGGIFDLKQGHGGIADIEFIIQYGVLRWAADYPQLLETTGMLPLLSLFAQEKLLDELACKQLGEAFKAYRAETHRLTLQNKQALVDNQLFIEQRQQVTEWWTRILVN
jgi:glutamate-ammonia-ligase adenylyltransferase